MSTVVTQTQAQNLPGIPSESAGASRASGDGTEMGLFSPVKLGAVELANRVVMAPMTRNRASNAGHVPTPLMAEYYRQRAGAGLIVTEATQVSPRGIGYPDTPGIHSAEQVEGWRRATDAVHRASGRIVLQLWHVGRASHPLYQPGGALPVAPSAVAPRGQVYTPQGMKPYVTPRALETEEIAGVVADFARGAANAKSAGFDGVELHAANGYLIDQFLRDGTNRRTDRYGGSPENRARFLLEVTRAVRDVWGAGRVGVRLSPSGTFNDMFDSNSLHTFGHAARALSRLDLAYLHVVAPDAADERHAPEGWRPVPVHFFRPLFNGAVIGAGGYSFESAAAAVAAGEVDAVAFAKAFIANPDLVERFRRGAPLAAPDPATFYGGGEKGYCDYPPLAA
jgi:N-ethylmaleimide reductase